MNNRAWWLGLLCSGIVHLALLLRLPSTESALQGASTVFMRVHPIVNDQGTRSFSNSLPLQKVSSDSPPLKKGAGGFPAQTTDKSPLVPLLARGKSNSPVLAESSTLTPSLQKAPSDSPPLEKGAGGFSSSSSAARQAQLLDEYKGIPPYTQDALVLEIEGEVSFSLTVTQEGQVAHPKIIKSLGYGLDEQALAALEKYRFLPATNGFGEPQESQIVYTFVFRLR